jgi:sortase A
MKKSFIAVLIIVFAGASIAAYRLVAGMYAPPLQVENPASPAPSPIENAAVEPSSAATTPPAVTIQNPSRVRIPSLGVNAPVESVGLDEGGRMDVPKDYDNVGWYNRGFKPGEIGSAVVAGHLDSPTGAAVFYRLEQLGPGDEVIVEGSDGSSLTFVVETSRQYADASFPINQVFDTADTVRLNLITCDGIFNRSSRLYSHRLVVYTVLKADAV